MGSDAFRARFMVDLLRARNVLDILEGQDQLGRAELDADLEIELGLDSIRAGIALVEARTALLRLEVAYRQLELLEDLTSSRTGFGTGRALCIEISGQEVPPEKGGGS